MSGHSYFNTAFQSDDVDNATSDVERVDLGSVYYINGISPPRRNSSTQTGHVAQTAISSGQDKGDGQQPCGTEPAKGLLAYYVKYATIHGIAQATGPRHYSYRRPIWMILVVGMAVGLGLVFFSQMAQVYNYPFQSTTKVAVNTELAFPAVTICNLNQYIKERVPDIPILKKLLFYYSEYARMTLNASDPNNAPDLENLTDVSGEELWQIARNAAPRLHEFLHVCFWESQRKNCEDLFQPISTTYGTCFLFNGAGDRLVSSGSESSLRVLAHTQNNQSYFSRLIHAGIKVIVHEPDQVPYPESDGWFIRPGVAASLAISRTDSINLPYPYKAFSNGYCEDTKSSGHQNKLKYFDVYSETNCLHNCLMEFLDRACDCQHYFFTSNQTTCSAKKTMTCLFPVAGNMSLSSMSECACSKACETVSYDAQVSYADLASAFIIQQSERDGLIQLSDNLVDVKISYKTLNVFQVIQEPSLTKATVLGQLGGQMGLFLGASILSITELLEIIVLCLMKWFTNVAHVSLSLRR